MVWEPPFCNGSRRLSTGPKEAEGWGGPQGRRRGGREGGKVQPQTPGGKEGAPARPTEGQKVLRKKMGAVGTISELNETSKWRARPFTFRLLADSQNIFKNRLLVTVVCIYVIS